MPASRSPSLYGTAVFHKYMRMRPFCPSGGVMKFALLNPDPSCAFAITASFSRPPRPKLYCWKLPETSSKPYLEVYHNFRATYARQGNYAPVVEIVHQVCSVEKLGDGGIDVLLCLCHSAARVRKLRVVCEVEHQIFASIWAVVLNERILTFPVLLRKDLN
jgi:hypothetical protein